MGMTMVEKILAKATGQASVCKGDVVEPRVDLAMSHENGALVLNQFLEIYKGTGLEARVWDPSKIAIIFDHRVPAESAKTATNQKKVREFVEQQGIGKFHDIRGDEGGICHQILPENGYVRPGNGGGRHRQPHHQPRRAGSLRLRHRRHRDGFGLDPGKRVERRSAGDYQSGGKGKFPRICPAQGPDPVPDRPAHGRRRQLQGDRISRSGYREYAHLGAPDDLQHGGGGRRDCGDRPCRTPRRCAI